MWTNRRVHEVNDIGKHFEEIGDIGKAKHIFNNTLQMNATVVDKSTIVCDSLALESTNGDTWYNISVTVDGLMPSSSIITKKYSPQ
jgi:hypothetical protein